MSVGWRFVLFCVLLPMCWGLLAALILGPGHWSLWVGGLGGVASGFVGKVLQLRSDR